MCQKALSNDLKANISRFYRCRTSIIWNGNSNTVTNKYFQYLMNRKIFNTVNNSIFLFSSIKTSNSDNQQ